jgi:hypothetical protein
MEDREYTIHRYRCEYRFGATQAVSTIDAEQTRFRRQSEDTGRLHALQTLHDWKYTACRPLLLDWI